MRSAQSPTLEIVINPWCPAHEVEIVEAAVISRPTRTIDAELVAAYAQGDELSQKGSQR